VRLVTPTTHGHETDSTLGYFRWDLRREPHTATVEMCGRRPALLGDTLWLAGVIGHLGHVSPGDLSS